MIENCLRRDSEEFKNMKLSDKNDRQWVEEKRKTNFWNETCPECSEDNECCDDLDDVFPRYKSQQDAYDHSYMSQENQDSDMCDRMVGQVLQKVDFKECFSKQKADKLMDFAGQIQMFLKENHEHRIMRLDDDFSNKMKKLTGSDPEKNMHVEIMQ